MKLLANHPMIARIHHAYRSCQSSSRPGLVTAPGARYGSRHLVAIIQSLPGTGRIVLSTLLAEAFEPLQRADYPILRKLCGVAPVTHRSGKSRTVTRRLACNPRLRNAIHYLADAARRCDEISRAKYLALKARGCSHARALRTIGDRLLYVACAMLKRSA
jgi:transposase